MMPLVLVQESLVDLNAYGSVPCSFTTTQRWKGGPLETTLMKDYDRLAQNRPADWPRRFDLSGWRFAAAYLEEVRAGGVAVVLRACEVEKTAQVRDAVLWDLRVHPGYRRRGVGSGLLGWAEMEARCAGRTRLLVETQDVNMTACEFYSANGYGCVMVEPFAYPELPDEARVLWAKRLG